jgi:hypothetical protein
MLFMKMFTDSQLEVINNAVAVAEDIVCDFYKMSASQWLRHRYDIKTLADLSDEEVVDGPFAQIIRYTAYRQGEMLGSSAYDFYKICLQDNAILATIKSMPQLRLFPFSLYIIIHELVHIVRFARFHQRFDASPEEKEQEEARVHGLTRDILALRDIEGMKDVLKFYERSP